MKHIFGEALKAHEKHLIKVRLLKEYFLILSEIPVFDYFQGQGMQSRLIDLPESDRMLLS